MRGNFYFGCPNCPEPKTTLEDKEHVFIHVTSIRYGIGHKVVIECTSCGAVQEISTDKIKSTSLAKIQEMLC